MTEATFSAIKTLITEYGTADAERVGARLSLGAERLAQWLALPAHGFEIGEADMPAIRALCTTGIHTKFSEIAA